MAAIRLPSLWAYHRREGSVRLSASGSANEPDALHSRFRREFAQLFNSFLVATNGIAPHSSSVREDFEQIVFAVHVNSAGIVHPGLPGNWNLCDRTTVLWLGLLGLAIYLTGEKDRYSFVVVIFYAV